VYRLRRERRQHRSWAPARTGPSSAPVCPRRTPRPPRRPGGHRWP
jgi:hypothetical protein